MERVFKEDFLELTTWDEARLRRVLDLAVRLKAAHRRGRDPQPFAGRHMALLFQKPSLRTRVSFEIGFSQLGGRSVYTSPAEVGLGERESAADVARVLGGYVDVIVARVFAHSLVQELAAASAIPVVNGLSDYNHPCQIFADLLTIKEHRGTIDGAHIAWIGDGNNVATSWINAARRLPIRVTLACPKGYDPDPAVLRAAEAEVGDRVRLVREPQDAVVGAHVIYADTWYSMGQEAEKVKRQREFAGYTIDDDLMALAPEAVLMHCLPAHRGDEVSAAVFDGPRSIVFQQAENRLHAQKAILLSVMQAEAALP